MNRPTCHALSFSLDKSKPVLSSTQVPCFPFGNLLLMLCCQFRHTSPGIKGGCLQRSSQANDSPVHTFVGAPQKRSYQPVCPELISLLQQTLSMKQAVHSEPFQIAAASGQGHQVSAFSMPTLIRPRVSGTRERSGGERGRIWKIVGGAGLLLVSVQKRIMDKNG